MVERIRVGLRKQKEKPNDWEEVERIVETKKKIGLKPEYEKTTKVRSVKKQQGDDESETMQ